MTAATRLWSPGLILVVTVLFLGALLPNVFVLAARFLGERGYDQRDIGVIMGSFSVASLACSPAVGWMSARFGHARVLATGCVVCASGAFLFDATTTMVGFAIARGLQGVGFAAVLVGGAAYVAETAPAGRLGEALGVSGVLTLTAQAVGPAAASAIHDLCGWSWVWRVGGISGLAGALVALALPAAVRRDLGDDGPRAPAAAALAASVLAGLGFGAIWTFLADYGPRAGVPNVTPFFVAYVAAAVSTRLLLGRLSDRIGRRAAATPALCGHAIILVVMAGLGATWHLVVIGLVYGLCHGIYYPTLQAMIVERSGGRRSRAIAASTFAFGAGTVTAAFGLGPLARELDYPIIYLVAAGAGAVAAALVGWGDRKHHPVSPAAT